MADPTKNPQQSDSPPSTKGPSSSPYRHLAKAPIREALIYFRAALPPQFDLALFRALHGKEALSAYPQLDENRNYSQTLRLDPRTGLSMPSGVEDNGLVSYVFRSADKRNVAQFRRDGFVFSRLRPYTAWEQVFAEAWRLWLVYFEIAHPPELASVGVRYINQITLPMDSSDLNIYLNATPRLAPGWPGAVGAFFTQVTLHEPEIGANAQVSQRLEPRRGNSVLSVLLDIDVSTVGVLNPADPGLVGRFEDLRRAKNRIFFGALTEKAIHLFQQ